MWVLLRLGPSRPATEASARKHLDLAALHHHIRVISLRGLIFIPRKTSTSLARMSSGSATTVDISSCLQRLLGRSPEEEKSEVEFIYFSQPTWPLGAPTTRDVEDGSDLAANQKPIRISILDSSFNPPTIAHHALAASRFPVPSLSVTHAGPSPQAPSPSSLPTNEQEEREGGDYDSHMLLLSVTNADKKLKEGDATYEQRLEMMILLAKELEASSSSTSSNPLNICVVAIDEPTFAGKSKKLRKAIAQRLSSTSFHHNPTNINSRTQRDIELYFILGFDTVIRLFDPRFYGSDQERMKQVLEGFFGPSTEGGDGSSIICASRLMEAATPAVQTEEESTTEAEETQKLQLQRKKEMDFFTSPPVYQYWRNGRVRMMELAEDLQKVSSTQVRQAVKRDDKRAIGRLVPHSIMEYISSKGLYPQN
jgi:nicotinamide-nucleotide adenylyltransferase